MFEKLNEINHRPAPFEHYTAEDLWTEEHTSSQMLSYHLNGNVDLSSRRTEFIERSAAWIVSRFDLGSGKHVADFGCGPGLYTSRLATSGAAIAGIDFSQRSIDYASEQANKHGQSIDYIHSDYLKFESDSRFDLITMIMCDFCALSPDQRREMLDRFLRHLLPGGALLMDAYSLEAFDQRQESASYEVDLLDGFWSADPYYGFLNVFKYSDQKVVLDKYTIVERDRTRVVYNWLQYFDRASIESEMEGRGFVVDELLGDVAGSPLHDDSTEFAVVARKPARG